MFCFFFQEELSNASNNDTGIDVNDVSTADETTENFEDASDTPIGTTKK